MKPIFVFSNEFSKETFESTYSTNNETITERFLAISRALASIEKPELQKKTELEFIDLFTDLKFIPGGRIISNAGKDYKGTTLINCFVQGPTEETEDCDSIENIMNQTADQVKILKSEGGYGHNFDYLRPNGCFIKGIGARSPGAVSWMEMWDTNSGVVTRGSSKQRKENKEEKGKIRKGAMMGTLSIWHPDIEEFITAKQTPGRLSKFNLSVLVSDEFINAVINHLPWTLEYPDTQHSSYKKEWKGILSDWKKKGYPTEKYKTFSDANELWDLIMKSTYNRAEPGILFYDTINNKNNLRYLEKIVATNPCGEQLLPNKGGVCLLGSHNLTQYINAEGTDFDYKKLEKYIPIAVRFLDNVNDYSMTPLPIQKWAMVNKRRIGMGITGLGSALLMMKIPYGSDKSVQVVEKLMSFIADQAYKASAMLAKEKGSFSLFDKNEYLNHSHVLSLCSKETRELVEKYGLRNSHLLSIQPTGNTSILANLISGGLEPLFLTTYIRSSIVQVPPEGMTIPKISWDTQSFFDSHNDWEWSSEGDERILKLNFNGVIYKIDRNRGLTKETTLTDYGVQYLMNKNEWNPNAEYVKVTDNLTVNEHIKIMEVLSKYVDSAISKTVNVPNDYSYEDFKDIYLNAWRTGTIKGITTYRSGTMTSVLKSVDEKETNPTELKDNNAVKRPLDLPCIISKAKVDKEQFIFIVSLLDKKPYEVFSFKEESCPIPNDFTFGIVRKDKTKGYVLKIGAWSLEGIVSFGKDENMTEALNRSVSQSLRHGVNSIHIVEQLLKTNDSVTSYPKVLGRILKKHITEDDQILRCPSCKSKNVSLQEGCFVCRDCSSSKC